SQQHCIPLRARQAVQRNIEFGSYLCPKRRIGWQGAALLPAKPTPSSGSLRLYTEFSTRDGSHLEEPASQHRFLAQLSRAPGEDKKHRARDLQCLSRI